MVSNQDVRDFVSSLERLVFELAGGKQLSPEQVRLRIAHKIAELGLIDRESRYLRARRPWEDATGPA